MDAGGMDDCDGEQELEPAKPVGGHGPSPCRKSGASLQGQMQELVLWPEQPLAMLGNSTSPSNRLRRRL